MIVNKLIWVPSLVCSALYAEQTGQHPNVIIMYIDDMGIGDVSCFGGSYTPTPNIDRLAQQGLSFMPDDRTERHDLSAEKPQQLKQLILKWEEWANTHNVFPKGRGGRDTRLKE